MPKSLIETVAQNFKVVSHGAIQTFLSLKNVEALE